MPDINPFIDGVRVIRSWSQQPRPTRFANTCAVSIPFDGNGAVLTVGRTKMWKMGFTGRLVMVEIFGDVATGFATLDLQYGNRAVWPVLAPAYGTGVMPGITIATPYYSGELNLTTYNRYYQMNDILWTRLITVSGFLNLTLVLSFQIFEAPGVGVAALTSGGTPLTVDGDEITFRI